MAIRYHLNGRPVKNAVALRAIIRRWCLTRLLRQIEAMAMVAPRYENTRAHALACVHMGIMRAEVGRRAAARPLQNGFGR